MNKILFYYPPNTRSVALETLIKEIKLKGYDIEVLTLSENGAFHEKMTELGIKWTANPLPKKNKLNYYFKQTLFFYKFCKKNDFDVVWSHLQPCNLVASVTQYFIRARVVIFRHHFHAIIKQSGLASVARNERIIEWLTCKLAKEIVVPSSEVYNGMVNYEKINFKKIEIIPYIYDFKSYGLPPTQDVKRIRDEYKCQLLIIMVARIIPMKRHYLLFPVFKKLIDEGYNIKVLVLDEGTEKAALQKYCLENNLQDRIFFIGYVPKPLTYMAASDVMVHPSYTDASSNALKEMGILDKPVIVCAGVGDVDEYIINGENGFVVNDESDEANQFEKHIRVAYADKNRLNVMGVNLHKTVLEKFTPNEHSLQQYLNKTIA